MEHDRRACESRHYFDIDLKLTTIENIIPYNICPLSVTPKNLHKHCLQIPLGPFKLPRETEDNAYKCKIWG